MHHGWYNSAWNSHVDVYLWMSSSGAGAFSILFFTWHLGTYSYNTVTDEQYRNDSEIFKY